MILAGGGQMYSVLPEHTLIKGLMSGPSAQFKLNREGSDPGFVAWEEIKRDTTTYSRGSMKKRRGVTWLRAEINDLTSMCPALFS